MADSTKNTRRWWHDRALVHLVVATVGIRLLVTAIWAVEPCVRDECMYLFTADRMVKGLGMTATNGWIWAPGQVVLLALHDIVTFGNPATLKVTQCLLAGLGVAMIYRLGQRLGGQRPALLAGWLYAVSPTMIFFSSRLWSESTYSVLLLVSLLALLKARDGPTRSALLPGLLLGACVLLRGVATYMLPVFAIGLLWRRHRQRAAWVKVLLLVVATAGVVAPYSVYATRTFDSFVLSDRTMGQMMWLGNNTFAPITFDYGNGQLSQQEYDAHVAGGRPHCAQKTQPAERDACETAEGVDWIKSNPEVFAQRIPYRLAQLMNPHSFLTRHLKVGGWRGLPDVMDEVLIRLVVAFSFVTVLGAALGAWGSRGGAYLLMVTLTTAYHLAAVGMLAGLSRYRVPIDTIWMVYAGLFLAQPRQALATIWSSNLRLIGATVTLGVLLALMLRFLPHGFQ